MNYYHKRSFYLPRLLFLGVYQGKTRKSLNHKRNIPVATGGTTWHIHIMDGHYTQGMLPSKEEGTNAFTSLARETQRVENLASCQPVTLLAPIKELAFHILRRSKTSHYFFLFFLFTYTCIQEKMLLF